MKLIISFLLLLVAIGFHIYLAIHYYDFVFAASGSDSVCNLNSLFNCDSVTASRFSAFLGIPMALWGAVTNAILAILVLGWIIRWTDELARLARYTLWLSLFIALTSVVMGALSTLVIGTYCIFCIGTYVISFVVAYLIGTSQEESEKSSSEYLKELFGPAWQYLGLLAAIPVLSFFINNSLMLKYGAGDIDRVVRTRIAEWKINPEVQFTTPASFKAGASDEEAKFIITEFADFLCIHCKNAKPSIQAFMRSRPDVQVHFYSFPLDGSCNDVVTGRNGMPCLLAKATYCAESVSQQGWALHNLLFLNQEKFQRAGTLDNARKILGDLQLSVGIQADDHKECIESPDTHEAIKAQAKAGHDAGVQGTPSFFINGRKLDRAQVLPILEAAYATVK
jgi:protein-disulfide isomerase/uncharacterized membrane protein